MPALVDIWKLRYNKKDRQYELLIYNGPQTKGVYYECSEPSDANAKKAIEYFQTALNVSLWGGRL